MSDAKAPQSGGQLQRRLGSFSAISITVGAVIGSGIFLKPLGIAQELPAEGWIHLFWAALGVVCLCGAFAYAELGAMFPQAGGQYAFLREAWGPMPAFLYGWVFFWAINSGTIAALASAFAEYVLPWFGVPLDAATNGLPGKLAACAMILVLATVNHFGVLIGAIVQNVSTFAKVAALVLLALAGLFVAGGATDPASAAVVTETRALTLGGVVATFLAIFWAYEGWYQLPFNAAELKDPNRALPRGLIGGMLLLIAIYVAVNLTYLRVVPFEEMRGLGEDKSKVASLTIGRVFGEGWGNSLTLLVALSVFGAANPNFLSSPRGFYAMAEDGLMPRALIRVHPRWGTPTASIWLQALWAAALIFLVPPFGNLSDFVVFAAFLFYGLTVAGVWRLRKTRPELPRPYRCTGYPLTPAIFVIVSVLFVGALLSDPSEQINALKGLAVLATGIAAWYLWARHRVRILTR
ncbi:MAG: amino acid permease [Planctomycetes bacterium]|nr:amino acid permease [Planctomycetota bacterium]